MTPVRRSPRVEGRIHRVSPYTTNVVTPLRDDVPVYRLVVQPLIKTTVLKRDSSGETLDFVEVRGCSFSDVVRALWSQLNQHIKGRAVEGDHGAWTLEPARVGEWKQLMQFKSKSHIVDSNKTEQAWRKWLAKNCDTVITLVVYKYGMAIASQDHLDEFVKARAPPTQAVPLPPVVQIRPQNRDPGAANEPTDQLPPRPRVEATAAQLPLPPPRSHLAPRRLAVDASGIAARVAKCSMPSTAHLALECVNAAIEDHRELVSEWKKFGERLDMMERSLTMRQSLVESVMRDLTVASPSQARAPRRQ